MFTDIDWNFQETRKQAGLEKDGGQSSTVLKSIA
jgi:hypothetical protein